MKKSPTRLLIIACMSTIVLGIALFTSSCQKDDPASYDKNKWNSYEWLDISDKAIASDIIKWSNADIENLRQAEARMTFKRDESGLLYIEEKSAEELNISPRLYAYSKQIVDNTNRFILRKAAEMKLIPRTKSASSEEGQQDGPTDCVAQTIQFTLSIFGITVSANEINAKFEEEYGKGKGVPASQFINVLQQYLKGKKITVDQIPSKYSLKDNSTTVYLVAANIVNMGGHAAPVTHVDRDWVFVKDIQNTNNKEDLQIHKNEVLNVFKSTGGAENE